MQVTLDRLAYTDINLLRELRNAAADSFFDSRYITVADQEDWWWRYEMVGESVDFYTIWLNHVTPVGFLSVKQLQYVFCFEVREIGNLLLAPAHRGRGIMHAAITEVRRLYSPLTFWVAHVKSTNQSSQRVFARQKFIQLEPSTTESQTQWDSNQPSTKRASSGYSTSSAARSSRSR